MQVDGAPAADGAAAGGEVSEEEVEVRVQLHT